jgi:MFS-type transporter involved in bile tolerance (Atg22 family)
LFGAGVIVLVVLVLASAGLWFAGVRDDRRPDVLTWALLGLAAGNVILLAVELTPDRLLRRLTRRQSTGKISAIGVASAYSSIVVANALVVIIFGLGLFLASRQAWRLAVFAVLAVAGTSLLWRRLDDCLEALADADDS